MKKLNKSLTFSMVFAIIVLSASFSVNAAELNSVKNNGNFMGKTTYTIDNFFDKYLLCKKHPTGCPRQPTFN
jgi:hypothetical protein